MSYWGCCCSSNSVTEAEPLSETEEDRDFVELPDFGKEFDAPHELLEELGSITTTLGILFRQPSQETGYYAAVGREAFRQNWEMAIKLIGRKRSLLDIELYFCDTAPEQLPNFAKLLDVQRSFRTISIMANSLEASSVDRLAAALHSQPETERLGFDSKTCPVRLRLLLETSHFTKLLYLGLGFTRDVLMPERWNLPRLETLEVSCYRAQRELKLAHLTSLRAVVINCGGEVDVSFGPNCEKLRKLILIGNVRIHGDISRVAYLSLKTVPIGNRIVRQCMRSLRELCVTGENNILREVDMYSMESILVDATVLRLLVLRNVSVGSLRYSSTASLDAIMLTNVRFSTLPVIQASKIYLNCESNPLFLHQLAASTTHIGRPTALAIVAGERELGSRAIRTILSSPAAANLTFFATNVALMFDLRGPRLVRLGLQTYSCVAKVDLPIDLVGNNRPLKVLSIFSDDGNFETVKHDIERLTKKLCLRHVPPLICDVEIEAKKRPTSPATFFVESLGYETVLPKNQILEACDVFG